MILFSSLALLTVLVVLGIAIRVMLSSDYRVLSNLRGSTEAFYLSVAGLEWAKNEFAAAVGFPPTPAEQSKNFGPGRFSVSFVSTSAAGPLSARVVVRSVGTIGPSAHVLQARLLKTYELADAALGLRGNAGPVRFGENPIVVSGLDHNPATGGPLPLAPSPRPALSLSTDAQKERVLDALGDPLRAGLFEAGADVPALSLSNYLPTSLITQLADGLCSSAGVIVTTIPDSGSLTVQDQTWGSPDAPQVRCVRGLPVSGDSLALSGGVTGAGILIVKDADLILAGGFRWEGLIILSGDQAGFRVMGSGNKEVYGAVLLNETGLRGDDSYLLDIQGNLRLLFSRQALSRAANLVPAQLLSGAYSGLPSVLSQEYWRALNP